MPKTLVLYVFHEVNQRVKNFIEKAVFYDENIDFLFISNKRENIFEVPSYVKRMYRDNIGVDFGGWSDGLLTDDLYKNYDFFIFVNSSVSGPFLPSYYKGKWTDIYLDGLKDNVRLFGSTINTCVGSNHPLYTEHIQSYIFSMDREVLEYLIQKEIFTMKCYSNSIHDAVINKEILQSRLVIEKGWNIGCLLPCYNGVDFCKKEQTVPFFGDIMHPEYRNKFWNEYEIVFVKGNRCGF